MRLQNVCLLADFAAGDGKLRLCTILAGTSRGGIEPAEVH
jgi:hypothetical protein